MTGDKIPILKFAIPLHSPVPGPLPKLGLSLGGSLQFASVPGWVRRAALAALRSSSPAAGLRLPLQPDHQRIRCVQRHAGNRVAAAWGRGMAQSLNGVPLPVVEFNGQPAAMQRCRPSGQAGDRLSRLVPVAGLAGVVFGGDQVAGVRRCQGCGVGQRLLAQVEHPARRDRLRVNVAGVVPRFGRQ